VTHDARDPRRDDRRLILAGLAGLIGGALLIRRSTIWLAIGAGLGLLAGRRLRGSDLPREERDAGGETRRPR
jgi:hypothetical protein